MIYSLLRLYELKIGDLIITGLRCKFVIDSGFNNQVKKGIFTISNISEDSLNRIEKDQLAIFSVIDENNAMPVLFQGLVVNRDRRQESDGTITTRILCWSGGIFYRNEKRSIAFEKNSTGNQVLSRLIEEVKPISINLSGSATEKVNNLKYKNGLTLSGNLPRLLKDFANDLGEQSTLDNNVFLIGSRESNIIKISSEIGNLIKSPSVAIERVEIEASLTHGAMVGDLIDLNSKYFTYSSAEAAVIYQRDRSGSGIYQTWNYEHIGDTKGSQWMTKFSLGVERGR